MNSSNTTPPSPPLDDEQLTQRLAALVHQERALLVEFLQHLAQFDARKLYAGFGYPSMYAYCTERLRLSDASAYRRIAAARLLQRFPVIADFLADGRLSLKRICLLRNVLSEENHADLLVRASLGTEDDVEVLVASICPRPEVSDSIRKLPSAPVRASSTLVASPAPTLHLVASTPIEASGTPAFAHAPEPALLLVTPTSSPPAGAPPSALVMAAPAPAPISAPTHRAPHMDLEPASATTHVVRLTVSSEFVVEFERVKAALSHKIPDGDFEEIFRECFRVTLDACERRRCGSERTRAKSPEHSVDATQPAPTPRLVNEKPLLAARPAQSKPRSRYIPAAVRHAVWKRDGGVCAFVSADGKRCCSNYQVDFHHEVPFASGGPSTVENLSLRCRVHNHYEAVLDFGAEFIESRIARALSADEKSPSRGRCGVVTTLPPEPDTAH